ncbi:hypothetical protein DL98DRAFT_577871 [Cadophora sp. DSE1049]|nr:hypothetical protein DL98DRAFT_577871 [Cadophora sp. DSE1049]
MSSSSIDQPSGLPASSSTEATEGVPGILPPQGQHTQDSERPESPLSSSPNRGTFEQLNLSVKAQTPPESPLRSVVAEVLYEKVTPPQAAGNGERGAPLILTSRSSSSSLEGHGETSDSIVATITRLHLDQRLEGQTTLFDVSYPSELQIRIMAADDVDSVKSSVQLPPPRAAIVSKTAVFIFVGGKSAEKATTFANARLLTTPIDKRTKNLAECDWWKLSGLSEVFGEKFSKTTATTSLQQHGLPHRLLALPWTQTSLAIDGRFTAQFIVHHDEVYEGWAWLLVGARTDTLFGVLYPDKIKETDTQVRAILIPPSTSVPQKHDEGGKVDCHCDPTLGRVPAVLSDTELADNPDVYSEDPGSFCKPFSNPERILSEKAFYSVVRVEQPEISSSASSLIKGPFVLNENHTFVHPRFPVFEYLDVGRQVVSAEHPIQWEGDSLRYQATTVAKGHVLEFRMRTRSSGYSLGGVAKTLTLAPRQAKRIQKIDWVRSERATRVERTQLTDTTNDNMSHETSYQDSVAASLNEWAQGSSQSSVTAAAAGGGLALGPVVIGGGVAHSSSQSGSQQSGGRNTTAAEQSQWRDAIRRHGDGLRKLESMVVQEVSQAEEVTGTTEVIRNVNYAHSLTVIYHNILRHLRVDIEFAGARECLFVPFAIRPFTLERALRWKESITRALRRRTMLRAMTYLKDVATDFAQSSIPAGRRSDHPIRSMWGSLYIDIGIDRPADGDKGVFAGASWSPLLPFLSSPALMIWTLLGAFQEGLRDSIFQQRYAPGIATKWCNTLLIRTNSGVLDADFTLATPYRFNGTVRVDFQVNPDGAVTRETLSNITVLAHQNLPPGSVANLKSLTYNYETDYDRGSVTVSRGLNDLINSDTGASDPVGARLNSTPNAYERQDMQSELRTAVKELVYHLNEYVEWYHKAIWWSMDRDRLFMLLDGFTVPHLNRQVSIANVVERDPIAVAGNSLVFRVSAGVFLGSPEISIESQEDLYSHYNANQTISDPMRISLPTDGLYAQTIMDECVALEEHHGNQDWVLDDPDPELGALDSSLLTSRRAEPPKTDLTPFPTTIINLTNSTPAPAPQGISGALNAVQNAGAFRDMAGLAGTQALATAGLQTAASLATTFGGSAASLKLAEMQSKQQAVADADKKLASIQRAKDKKLVTDEDAAKHASKVLEDFTGAPSPTPPHENPAVQSILSTVNDDPSLPKTIQASNAEGSVMLAFGITDPDGGAGSSLSSAGSGSVIGAASAALATRPTWTQFSGVYWTYASVPSETVQRRINPAWVNNTSYGNTCCMRLSQALKDSGYAIPADATKVPGVVTEYSALMKARYIVRVSGMLAWLPNVWGAPDWTFDKAPNTAFDKTAHPELTTHKGVIGFQIRWNDATGHFDLWDGTNFSHELSWDGIGTNPTQYFNLASKILVWYLTDPPSPTTA